MSSREGAPLDRQNRPWVVLCLWTSVGVCCDDTVKAPDHACCWSPALPRLLTRDFVATGLAAHGRLAIMQMETWLGARPFQTRRSRPCQRHSGWVESWRAGRRRGEHVCDCGSPVYAGAGHRREPITARCASVVVTRSRRPPELAAARIPFSLAPGLVARAVLVSVAMGTHEPASIVCAACGMAIDRDTGLYRSADLRLTYHSACYDRLHAVTGRPPDSPRTDTIPGLLAEEDVAGGSVQPASPPRALGEPAPALPRPRSAWRRVEPDH
jgi:hypothetical protein